MNDTETKNLILIYQYSERIKSELIIAMKLMARIDSLSEGERRGSEVLFQSYLEAVLAEIRIAENVEKSKHFLKAEKHMMDAAGKMWISSRTEIARSLSGALSAITTSCQYSMEKLERLELL